MPPAKRAPRVPQDHKPKKQPLQLRVPIVLDEAAVDALEQAQGALADAESKAQQEHDRLFNLGRRTDMSGPEIIAWDTEVREHVEKTLQPLRDALSAAQEAAEAATQIYTIQSIGRAAYRELIAEHAPREEDHQAQREDTGNEQALARWNNDTFPPALILACCADPVLTESDVEEMWAEWNDAEVISLFSAALAVNNQRRVVDLGKARG